MSSSCVNPRAIAAILYLGFGWSISVCLTKYLQVALGPLEQLILQSMGVVPFSFYYTIRRVCFNSLIALSRTDLLLVISRGTVMVAGSIFFFIAVKETSIATVTWLSILPYPVFWAWLLYKETPSKKESIWIIVSIIGTMLTAYDPSIVNSFVTRGAVFTIIGNLFFALGFTISKSISNSIGTIKGYFWATFFNALCALIAGLLLGATPKVIPLEYCLAISFGSLLWAVNTLAGFYGFSHLKAGTANSLLCTESIWALLLGIVLFSEIPTALALCGGIIILIATLGLSFYSK
jgi:drug/metabolite transporter (DMT)-like permease